MTNLLSSGLPISHDFASTNAEETVLAYVLGTKSYDELVRIDPNPDKLAKHLSSHRLILSFVNRIAREKGTRPSWCAKNWMGILEAETDRFLDIGRQQAQAICDLSRSVGKRHNPIVLVKGAAVSDLLGRPLGVKPSIDVDLFIPDVGRAWRYFAREGFDAECEEGTHEVGEFRRGEVIFEAHRCVPIQPFSSTTCGVGQPDSLLVDHGLVTTPLNDCPRLEYAELLANSLPSRTFGPLVAIPRLEWCALILIAHMSRDYVRSPLKKHIALRLGDLGDLRAILKHPEFDWGRFGELLTLHESWNAWAFAHWALLSIYGRAPGDLTLVAPPMKIVFPRCILYDSVTVLGSYVPRSFNELIHYQDIADLVQQIPHNEVYLGRGDQSRTYRFGASDEEKMYPALTTVGGSSATIGGTVQFHSCRDGLAVNVTLDQCSDSYRHYFALYFSDEVRVWSLVVENEARNRLIGNFPNGLASFDKTTRTYRCIVTSQCCKDVEAESFFVFLVLKRYIAGLGFDVQQVPTVAIPIRFVARTSACE